MKKKKLSEKEIAQTYEIVRGFNIPDGDGEKRFEASKNKFVTPGDFDEGVFEALIKGGALVPVEDPLKEDEVVVMEEIKES